MAEEVNYRQLLQGIETTLYDGVDGDPAAFLGLLQAARPAFLNLLRYKASELRLVALARLGLPRAAQHRRGCRTAMGADTCCGKGCVPQRAISLACPLSWCLYASTGAELEP